ncbi:trifunctional serine/threonine-protein kinase/ATP-binding protein/sensor histidine kinase [Argonema antarcticum]|uniref:trifunctional serine/threonine-protein kinase/ATP-binding protein/sensor histidine kinase n=1 Tax=Argonema antarcticum TaxID=2942763 RepID=UPI002012959B|nr:ATP-binding sensor histidine kinase [Argonema antarcticum]MCL1471039.1 AAA family ATPase [Argonema antarcticum A004/B2]
MNAITHLLGHRITEQLYAGDRTLVYRGFRESDAEDGSALRLRTPVVIKLLRNEYPNFSELVQFRNQYTIAKNLNLPSIVKPLDLVPYKNAYALIMEDFGGVSLSTYLKVATDQNQPSKSLSLENFLDLALQLADILHYLYQNRVIHKDIKPANILINPDNKQIKLIDFSISSLLPRETQEIQNPNILEGTLAYLSPEQTGRMNRGIDYRSDFYSLGVTFYELFTRQLPFVSDDPMELVHCHLAKQPIPAHQIQPKVPLLLSKIVSKLMAKNAENRYQSALGLKHDLEICLAQLQETSNIETFVLGTRDITDRFLIPEKLYGRETEVDNLLAVFERVSQGSTEMMLVAGFSGIGKTAVVNEVHKPIVRQRGYFIKGKYDQFQRNIPFSAFVQAFRDLMGQLLSESDPQLQIWKTRILSAVGDNGQVLIEVIPELERIIGSQPSAPELSGSAAQNRFNLLMQKFVQVFTTAEHPLVMFLDDLQWADGASLKLLQLLMEDTGHLLVLGAYRDNEVSPVHPFILTVDEIVKSGATVNTITLQPLSLADMNQLVADTLNCDLPLAQPLTELVYKKTQGNPFFATQFLKALHDDGLIKFYPPQSLLGKETQGGWQCDIAQVKALAITDDVVEFMALQLQKLPTHTQEVLKLAACIGAQFDINTLAIVGETSPEETAAVLWKSLQEGFILPTTEIYKFFIQTDSPSAIESSANPTYKFLHDRVQQAAYSLIPDSQKKATHLKIGQLLLQNSSEIQQEEKLFDIVRHLNQGEELITQQSERETLAKLNLKAGQKARNSTAYSAANIYLQTGIELLTVNCWQTQYELTINLYVAAAEAAYLNADLDCMEQMAALVLQEAQTILDKIKIYKIQIVAQTAQSKMLEAIAIARDALGQLGVELPTAPDEAKISKALQTLASQQSGRGIEELIDLPVMSDRQTQAAMQLLGMLFATVFQGMPGLMPILSATMVSLSLQYGNTPASTAGYAIHGMVLCAFLEEVETGYSFGRLSLNLLDGFNVREFKCTVLLLFGGFIQHRQESLRAMMLTVKDGYAAGMETGDFLNAGYCMINYFNANLFGGVELDTWEPEIAGYRAVLVQTKQYSARTYLDMAQQAVQNLRETRILSDCLIGDAYDETVMIPKHHRDNDLTSIAFAYIYKLLLAYFFGNYTAALEHSAQAKQYLMAVSAMIFIPIFHFYAALTHLALFPTQPEIEQAEILAQVETHQTTLHQWAQNAPMNHLHKWYLVEAEKQRVLGNKAEAIDLYDRAISLAKENQFLNEEALANELAAKFYLEWGKEKFAQIYAIEAYYAYSRWGAKAKVTDLEQRYPQLLAPILQQSRSSTSFKGTIALGTIASTRSSSSVSEALDLATLLKASQAISGEIELDKLLTTLLKIVITNAGADKCVLLLKQDRELQVVALVEEGQEPALLPPMPLQSSQDVAISLVNTVKRSLKPLVLADARINPQFASDRYIEQHQPKSVLCTPILNQGKLIGILYLENNLTVEAFTSDRVEVLNLICAQAAISLENARLYQESQQAFTDLKQAQVKIVQSEKMSALGNLVAGVAHEINNPVGFLSGNITPALDYINDLFGLIDLFQQEYPNYSAAIQEEIEAIDLDYIREDLPKLVGSMHEGVTRIKAISTSLRIFSRGDSDRPVSFNIHDGLDSTIMILKHRLKANDTRPEIRVIKKYGDLPKVEGYAGQINQVFMNLLANAIDALDESNQGRIYAEIANQITIKTALSPDQKQVMIYIKDNGVGMSEAVREKIFDDLFTTKGVGKGTGLGLAIARQIVVEKHSGTLEVNSTLGQGAEFAISIPVKANVAFIESQK